MNWEAYNQARVQNIKEQVSVADILEHYNIRVQTRNREFQYPCPLHGDGQDNSFSARLYPDDDGGSTFCFACNKSRDVVEWVKDAEMLPFGKALSYVERAFRVTNIPKPVFDPKDRSVQDDLQKHLDQQDVAPTLLDHIHRLETKLRRMVKEGQTSLQRDSVLKLFYVLDSLRYDIQYGEKTPNVVAPILKKAFQKVSQWEAQ